MTDNWRLKQWPNGVTCWLLILLAGNFLNPLAAGEPPPANSLAAAVQAFNDRAQANVIGRSEPLLTENEVVAAIRAWPRPELIAEEQARKQYQGIVETRTLPAGAELTFTTNKRGLNNSTFDGWWVDLRIKTGPMSGYAYKIRDRKIASRPLTEAERNDLNHTFAGELANGEISERQSRQIESGMSKPDVVALLGLPGSESKTDSGFQASYQIAIGPGAATRDYLVIRHDLAGTVESVLRWELGR